MRVELEKVIIVGLRTKRQNTTQFDESMFELERLVESAGGLVIGKITQALDRPVSRTYIGAGKIEELAALADIEKVQTVIFDDDLKPGQTRVIENAFKSEVKVLDRSGLILDIFAARARTTEARIQVELAQLEYLKPRLSGLWSHFSRQWGGSIGARGPGETQLETDRRVIAKRIAILKKKLEQVEKSRKVQRSARKGKFRVAILGYTNAGKTTLLNALTKAGAFAEDKLFATLDPRTRAFNFDNGKKILFTDTVGFIRKIPHHLIESFRSTLAEAEEADLLLIVAEAQHPNLEEHLEVVLGELERMKIENKPRILVLNKIDLADGILLGQLEQKFPDAIFICAEKGEGLTDLIERIKETTEETDF